EHLHSELLADCGGRKNGVAGPTARRRRALLELVDDRCELSVQVVAEGAEHADQHDGDQSGEQAILDGGGDGLVLRTARKQLRQLLTLLLRAGFEGPGLDLLAPDYQPSFADCA